MDARYPAAISGTRCSTLARQLGEPLAGSASPAATWLCIEQPGPWGRDALVQSHLDVGIGRELSERAKGTGVRVVLMRRPGNHPDRHRPIPRHVYLAHTAPANTWLERATVHDPKELIDLDFARIGAGEPAGLGDRGTAPLLLICTNARRDVCCAARGRPIAAALAPVYRDDVWECTHIGGHRFAPTGLLLPTGYSYGLLDLASASRLLSRHDGVVLDNCRGRSTWSPPGQVAELTVRTAIAERDPDAVRVAGVESGADRWRVTVSHVDGRRWLLEVVERPAGHARSPSCGADPKPAMIMTAEIIRD